MNKDERSAASTGADSEPHRSNDLNPASAPALPLPIQRLGSAMEPSSTAWWALVMGAAASIEDAANCLRDADANKQAVGAAKHYRDAAQKLLLASEVEALRQRPGAQAASEPITVAALARASDRKALGIVRGLNVLGADVTLNQPLDLALIGAALSHAGCSLDAASPAGERPAQAEPMMLTAEHRAMLQEIEGEFVALPDLAAWIRRLQDRLREALASPSARERPGAQASSTAAEGCDLCNAPIFAGRKCKNCGRLAAPSTGGAETAEPCEQGCHEKLEGRTACVGRCKQAARAAASSSAPAQAVETAGVREQDFEKGWRTAANWMERDDLIADIGGAAYLKDRAAALQSPAASPASKEDGAQLGSGAGAQSDSGADSGHLARAVQSEGSTAREDEPPAGVDSVRDYNNGYSRGFNAGVQRGKVMAQQEIERLNAVVVTLQCEAKERMPAPDYRAELLIVLPGRSEEASLRWPRDCDGNDLALIRDQIQAVMARWLKARPDAALATVEAKEKTR